jgi:O-antigen/teichoic acid export membrane protein
MAYQEGYLNSIIAIVGTVLGLSGLALAIVFEASLPVLVFALSAPPVLAVGYNALRLFRQDRPWLRPRWSMASRGDAVRLARVGFLFFVLQVAVAIAFQSDVLVAAAVIGPEAAATYAVTLRVFMFAPSLLGLFLLTLWPAYTEALARQDADWVKRTLRRSVVLAVGGALVASLALLATGSPLIRFFTGGQVNPPVALMLGAAIWAVVNACFNAVAMLMNAASIVLFQVVTAIVMALGSVVLSILFANWFGVSGIVWGTLIAYTVLAAIPVALYLPRVLRRLNEGTLGIQPHV